MRELREDTFAVDRLSLGNFDSWDLLQKAYIQSYCPLSKTAKQLEEIRNFKQEGDETLYQAWESSSSRNINSSGNTEGITTIDVKLARELILKRNVLSTRKLNMESSVDPFQTAAETTRDLIREYRDMALLNVMFS
ncbi:hypothetical protein Tco_1499173 [Tanacetum coccineum]